VSADPLVPFPTFSQSYNRYSYVLNSPLSYTDPSGFKAECVECLQVAATAVVATVASIIGAPVAIVGVIAAIINNARPGDSGASTTAMPFSVQGGGGSASGGAFEGGYGRFSHTNKGKAAPPPPEQVDGQWEGVVGTSTGAVNGAVAYFADQLRFLAHLNDLVGANGQESQDRAVVVNKVILGAAHTIIHDLEIEYGGVTVNARTESLNQLKRMAAGNPMYFVGRFGANLAVTTALSIPFYTGGIVGFLATGTFGIALQGTATLGAAVGLAEEGITHPVDLMSRAAFGKRGRSK